MAKAKKTTEKKDTIYPKIVLVEGALMANGEFIHFGKSLGWINERQRELVENGASKMARGTEIIIALGKEVA